MQEYQSKALLSKYNINTQKFVVGENTKELIQKAKKNLVADSSVASEWVVKAQVLAGGRGKGHFPQSGLNGGVHLVRLENMDSNHLNSILDKMFNHRLITAQTTAEGVLVTKVMIAEAVNIKKEAYLAILLDRQSKGIVLLGSPMGGMDIEKVAKEHPEAVFQEVAKVEHTDTKMRLCKDQAVNFVRKLGFPESIIMEAADELCSLYDLFIENDALQVEVNPFATISKSNGLSVMAVDAKIQIDENASFRQAQFFDQREDTHEQDPREILAAKSSLNYIGLDGNIGCLVNGAGLAMATMDMIQLEGGKPANFLDVGGNANKTQVKEAFKILSSDPNVKAILVNIFGGIMRCDVIASGILDALKELHNLPMPPIIVRLSGTRAIEGLNQLESQKIPILHVAQDMESAARLSVRMANHSTHLDP